MGVICERIKRVLSVFSLLQLFLFCIFVSFFWLYRFQNILSLIDKRPYKVFQIDTLNSYRCATIVVQVEDKLTGFNSGLKTSVIDVINEEWINERDTDRPRSFSFKSNVEIISPVNLEINNTWVKVSGGEFIAITAYYDKLDFIIQNKKVIRVLALKIPQRNLSANCVFMSADKSSCDYTIKRAHLIKINHQKTYSPHYICCPIDNVSVTNHISFIEYPKQNLSCDSLLSLPKLKIQEIPLNSSISTDNLKFTVCISPIFKWENILKLKLFLEHYLSQGFTHFMIYKRVWSKEVQDLLTKDYRKLVEIVHWPFIPKELDHKKTVFVQINNSL